MDVLIVVVLGVLAIYLWSGAPGAATVGGWARGAWTKVKSLFGK